MTAELHPACASIAFLVGRWEGGGRGDYPTIEPFEYVEEMTFTHVGKPFLAYSQRSRRVDTGEALHAETGYWRALPGGVLEVVLAHPTGHSEQLVGRVEGSRIELVSEAIGATPTAKPVNEIERSIDVTDGLMSYTLRMAAVGMPLTAHLAAELRRADGD